MPRQAIASAALAALALVVACAAPADHPTDPTPPAFAKSANAIAHAVTGSGRLDLVKYGYPQGTAPETYNFTILEDGTGDVKGIIRIGLTDPRVSITATPICLEVQNNLAWVEGVVFATSNAGVIPIGERVFFRVRDNGEGAAAQPDAISPVFYGAVNIGRCAARFNINNPAYPTPFEFDAGNIQVR